MSIFEQASRLALRFPTPNGEATVENLWQLPLTSTRGPNLNDIAITVNRELKAQGEESFVDARPNPQTELLTLKLEVVKHVIASKQLENAAKAQLTLRAAEVAKIEEILANKQNEALHGLSAEQLAERLKELKGS